MQNPPMTINAPAERTRIQRDGVLVTEALRHFGPMGCESCDKAHPGGIGRGLVLEERNGSDTPWTLWAFGDGWTTTDELAGNIAVCPEHQTNSLVRLLRFVNEDAKTIRSRP